MRRACAPDSGELRDRGRRRRRKIKAQHDARFGFNAATEQYKDLVEAGVIDPTKITRTALQNAASIASLMLTTEAMICGIVEVDE